MNLCNANVKQDQSEKLFTVNLASDLIELPEVPRVVEMENPWILDDNASALVMALPEEIEDDLAELRAAEAEDDPNDDWGNFEDVGGDNVAESQSWSHLQAEPASAADKPDIEFDESDDDEFGDFGEATTTVAAVEPVRVDPGDESSILKSLELLSVKSEELLRSIFETSVGEEHDDEEEEKDEMNLEKTVLVEVCNSDNQ